MKKTLIYSFALFFSLFSLFINLTSTSDASMVYRGSYGTVGNGYQFPACDKGGQVWVTCYDENTIRAFHPNGNLTPFTPIGTGKNASGTSVALSGLSGLAVDTAGIVYVAADNGSTGYIYKYQSWDGVALNGFPVSFRPGDIDIDTANRVYITEKVQTTARARFYIFNDAGTQFVGSPFAMAGSGSHIDRGIGVTKDGSKVYIVTETDSTLIRFTGSFSGNIANFPDSSEMVTGLASPGAVDVDADGTIYLSCMGDSTLRIYNANGTLRETLSGSGLAKPKGVAFYPSKQALFIAPYVGSGYLQRWTQDTVLQIPVLGYHDIIDKWNSTHSMFCSTDNFADQVKFLKNHGYNCVTLAQIEDHYLNGTYIGDKPVAFTFDDNYEGEVLNAGSILSTAGWSGTIFAHTYYVGYVNSMGARGSWSQLSTARTLGYMETQSHTVNHVNLTGQSESSAYAECTGSRSAIMANLPGHKAPYLGYPYGGDVFTSSSYSPRASVPALAARAGFNFSYSYVGGFSSQTTPPHNMPRVVMNGAMTLNLFKSAINDSSSRLDTDPYIVNNDGSGDGTVSLSGSWSSQEGVSNSYIGCYGSNYAYVSAGSGTKSASFIPSLEKAGQYDVYLWWDADTDRATNVPVTVYYSGGSASTTVNQQSNGFKWFYLGRYYFNAGTSGIIVMTDKANGIVTADAAKWEPVPATAIGSDWVLYQ